MDPITAVGALAAILQLAQGCIKTSKLLYKFAKINDIALAEIIKFCLDLRSFSDSLELAHMDLERHSRTASNSPVLQCIQKRGALVTLSRRSELINDSLKDVRCWLSSLRDRNKLLVLFKWWLKREEILAFEPEMQSVISRLVLMTTMVKQEVIYLRSENQPLSEDNKKEIRHLKRIIKNQMKYIQLLEKQPRPAIRIFGQSNVSLQASSLWETSTDQVLLELGENIIRHGKVTMTPPTQRPQSPKGPRLTTFARDNGVSNRRTSIDLSDESSLGKSSSTSTATSCMTRKPAGVSSHSLLSVSGYIVAPGQPAKFVTAVKDDRQRGNRISLTEALRLELPITPLSTTDHLAWLEDR